MKGFTLVELIIAVTITSFIAGIGITSFGSYQKSQVFGQAATEVADLLGVARSRAISQVKPATCGAAPLDGYEVRITASGTDYFQNVICGGTYTVARKKLPSGVTFSSGSTVSIFFNFSSGKVNAPGAFTISGFGKTSSILVEETGRILINNGTIPAAGGSPAATAAPTTGAVAPGGACTAPAYRYYPYYGCIYTAEGYGTYCDATCGGQVGGAPTTVPTAGASGPASTAAACSKDYYYSPPYCVYVGANRGSHCEATCGGAVSTAPTSSVNPTSAPTSAPAGSAPTSAPTSAPPAPTSPPTACSKDYYYSPPYCVYVGANRGSHCEATCGGNVSPGTSN